MIPCTVEMFNQNNHFPDETSQYYIGRKICPDMEHIKEFWKLKNGYSNQNERVSFNIQAAVCDNSTFDESADVKCAPEEDIIYLLERIYFTFYLVEDNVQFSDIGVDPYYTVDRFHS